MKLCMKLSGIVIISAAVGCGLIFGLSPTGHARGKDPVSGLKVIPLSRATSAPSPAVASGDSGDPRPGKIRDRLERIRSGGAAVPAGAKTSLKSHENQAERLRRALSGELQIHLRPFARTPRQIKVKSKPRREGKVLQQALLEEDPGREQDEKTARAFLTSRRGVLRLSDPETEMRQSRYFKDVLGRRHVRYTQVYRGLPVWPAELNIHLDAAGDVDLVNGAYVPTPRRMVTSPVWTADEALHQARLSISGADLAHAGDPELIIYAPGDRSPRLAWKIELLVALDASWLVVVDAANGKILTAYNRVPGEQAAGSGIDLFGDTRPLNVWLENGRYYMVDTGKPMYNPASNPSVIDKTEGGIIILDMENQDLPDSGNLYAPRASSAFPDSGWVPDTVSLAYNLSQTYDYFRERHGRDSINGKGGTILGFVRVDENYDNAFWTSEYNGVFFGDASPYAGALDVVAHECAHGVTAYTCNLIYRDQPGALNEAFSDIFGEMVEAWSTGETDWQNGTSLTSRRSLSDPSAGVILSGYRYPEKMSEFYSRSHPLLQQLKDQDYGGVHVNMTIVSHCFYLLAEGLPGAIGMADAASIFYRAQAVHLVSGSQFVDARLACITSAEELFGAGSAQAETVARAFDTVEIFEDNATPEPPPAQPVSGPDAVVFISADPDTGGSFLARYESALGDQLPGVWLSCYDVLDSRPSVSGDGRTVFFADSVNDACFIDTREGTCEECLGFAGEIYSVAMSPDEQIFGFVLMEEGLPAGSISVVDLRPGGQTRTFPLVAPATEGVMINTVEFAEAMDFTSDNRYLIYDAYNVLDFQDGSSIGVWSIYAIDLVTEQTIPLVGPFSDADVGFPALSQTTNHLLTFDLVDAETGETAIIAENLVSGDYDVVATIPGSWTAPAYTGDDRAIVYSQPDASVPTGYSLVRQPLDETMITPQGGPDTWVPDANFGVVYRRGDFAAPEPDIALSAESLSFGQVALGKTGSRTLAISNAGTGDLMVNSVSLSGTAESDYQIRGGCAGQKLPTSGVCQFHIDFHPSAPGARSATLTVTSDDVDQPAVSIPLTGTGADDAGGDDDSGGGGGGCFIGAAAAE